MPSSTYVESCLNLSQFFVTDLRAFFVRIISKRVEKWNVPHVASLRTTSNAIRF